MGIKKVYSFYKRDLYRKDKFPYKSKYGNIKPRRLTVDNTPWYNALRKSYNIYGTKLAREATSGFGRAVLDTLLMSLYEYHSPSVRNKLIFATAKTLGEDYLRSRKTRYLPKKPPRLVKNIEGYLHKVLGQLKKAGPAETDIILRNARRDIEDLRNGVYFRNVYRRRFSKYFT